MYSLYCCFFFQAECGIRGLVRFRGRGDVYKRQLLNWTLSRRGRGVFQVPRTATPLRDFFLAVGRILAGVPRGDGEREELALPYPAGLFRRTNTGDGWRIRKLASTLANWHGTDPVSYTNLTLPTSDLG